MPSPMLLMLQEVAAEYGPSLPLAQKLKSSHVPDEVLDGLPDLWAERRPRISRNRSQAYYPYIPEPFTSRWLYAMGSSPVLDFADEKETDHDWGVLRHHLLYADGLTISDPISKIFDPRYFNIAHLEVDEVLAYRRTRLANLARFLIEIDPLVEDGTIVFIPEPEYPIAYDRTDLRKLAGWTEIIRAVDHLDPVGKEIAARAAELQMGKPPGSMPFGPASYAGQTLNGILAGMVVGSEEGGSWDLYLPQREMQSVLSYMMKLAGQQVNEPMGQNRYRTRTLADLLSVRLPALSDKIRTRDLIALRKNGEAFAKWRRGLDSALAVLDDRLCDAPDMPQVERRKILKEHLADAAVAAQAEVGRSKALTELSGGSIEAMIGTAVGLGLGSFEGAVTGAGTSALAHILLRWLTGLRSSAIRHAVVRHYQVFTSVKH